MSVRISEMYGREIYDTNGAYVGKAHDIIVNLEAGVVVRIMTEPLGRIRTTENLEQIIKKKSILFSKVKNVQDIIVIEKGRR